jgi:multiple sugar transport system permease protein
MKPTNRYARAFPASRLLGTAVLVLLCVPFVYPFWWMLINSLNGAAEVFGPPRLLPVSWRWDNYREIFAVQPFARHYLNTLLVAVLGTAGNVAVASFSGYAFARMRFPGRNWLFVLLLTALMMPIEVTIIPTFFMMRTVALTDSLVPLILIPIFAGQGAFTAFMMRQYFVALPRELEEAACIEGLSPGGTFVRIILPLTGPVVASAAILAFLAIWNSFLEPLVFVNSLDLFTIPLSLSNFTDTYGLPQWHLQLAATTLSVVPILAVYGLFQTRITNAMVNSGVKG